VTIDRYDSDGSYLGTISKKCAGAHLGNVYSFEVGKEALAKTDGSPASYKKLKGHDAKIAIKDGKLKNTDVSHMSFETHIDTDGYLEVGMTSGLQKLYMMGLFGFVIKDPKATQSFSLGLGTQHCFCGPVMLNAEAYVRFARYTGYSFFDDYVFADKWLFAMIPATRFMLSIKPAKRIQFFSALELNYNIREMNEDYFYGGYMKYRHDPWVISNDFSIFPTVQFGIKL
jgi:hypothetical protein